MAQDLLSWISVAKNVAHTLVHGAPPILFGGVFMLYATERVQADVAQGLDNPTLSFNLSGVTDYDPGMRFLDLMKMMRPWMGHEAGQWGGMTIDELRSGGHLDADGWVKSIPDSVEKIGTLWQWKGMDAQIEDHKGVYVLKYEGKGTLQLSGDAKIISSEAGKITFENETGGNFYLNLYSTDPEGTGNYIRDISIVAEKNAALYEAGGTFNPEWLSLISDSRELRFMDWMETNNSEVITWSNRPSPDGPRTGIGVSVEDMVKLANELGVDPWFTMPHMADDDYIKNFAIYVRENLDPELHVKVEYSNEVWNWAFQQAQWVLAQSKAEWGVEAHVEYIAKKAVETAVIWQDVFEGVDDARLINVLGTQTNLPWLSKRLLDPVVWKENEPNSYVDPASVFEQLAVTSYFGGFSTKDKDARDGLISAILNPNIDANKFLADRLMNPDFKTSIPDLASKIAEHSAIADEYGLDIVAYEGGQHVHHLFNLKGLDAEDISVLTDFMIDFVRSDEMADLYRENWKMWADLSDGAFMQFGEIKTPNKYGSWALYNSLNDENSRALALKELNATSTPWWSAEGGVQYQQGITATGTAEADLMVGTLQEDYLMGGDGDDIFVPGRGNDGINGGDGTDRLVVSGVASDYTLRVEGKGYRLVGPDGSDFLVNVEEIAFDDDQIITLADLAQNPDGSIKLTSLVSLPVNKFDTFTVVIDTPELTDPASTEDTAILGGTGHDILKGSHGKDEFVLTRDNGVNRIKDFDEIQGGKGDEVLRGGRGNDKILGRNGDDVMFGYQGNDILRGGRDNDRILGRNGDDIMAGHKGDDILRGGRGNDLMKGGLGKDKFVFTDGDGMDKIKDFKENDTLHLQDFLTAGQALHDAVSNVDIGLQITNGDDRITLLGLDTQDLSWMHIQIS